MGLCSPPPPGAPLFDLVFENVCSGCSRCLSYFAHSFRNYLALTGASELEKGLIVQLQGLIVNGDVDIHQIQLACSVINGSISRDKTVMGVIEASR